MTFWQEILVFPLVLLTATLFGLLARRVPRCRLTGGVCPTPDADCQECQDWRGP